MKIFLFYLIGDDNDGDIGRREWHLVAGDKLRPIYLAALSDVTDATLLARPSDVFIVRPLRQRHVCRHQSRRQREHHGAGAGGHGELGQDRQSVGHPGDGEQFA